MRKVRWPKIKAIGGGRVYERTRAHVNNAKLICFGSNLDAAPTY